MKKKQQDKDTLNYMLKEELLSEILCITITQKFVLTPLEQLDCSVFWALSLNETEIEVFL